MRPVFHSLRVHWRGFTWCVVLVLLVSYFFQSCTSHSLPKIDTPPPVKVAPTTSTMPDFPEVALASAAGTTTTLPVGLRGGTASIFGRITIGGAPAANANVRIDRFDGDNSVGVDLRTNGDGRYELNDIYGGRYRVRAYRTPDGTANTPQILFLRSDERKQLDIDLRRFASQFIEVTSSIAPNPPHVGDTANVAVLLSVQSVDGNGVARRIGQGGIGLTLTAGSGREIIGDAKRSTNGSGVATWQVQCLSTDGQGLSVTTENGNVYNLAVASCQPKATTTTSTTTDSSQTTSSTDQPTTTATVQKSNGNGKKNKD